MSVIAKDGADARGATIKAVLFDMDGLLVDTEGPAQCVWFVLAVLWNWCKTFGVNVPEEKLSQAIEDLSFFEVDALARCSDEQILEIGTPIFGANVPVEAIKDVRGPVLEHFLNFHNKTDSSLLYRRLVIAAFIVVWRCSEKNQGPESVAGALEKVSPGQLLGFLGIPMQSCIVIAADEFGQDFPYLTFKQLRDELVPVVLMQYGVQPKSGVVEILEAAESQGLAIGLVTSSERNRAELLLGNLWSKFSVTVCGKAEAGQGKPHPDGWLKCAKALDVDIECCVGFEDSAKGVESLQRAQVNLIFAVRDVDPLTKVQNDVKLSIVNCLTEALPVLGI